MQRIPYTIRKTKFSIVNDIQEPVRLSVLCERRILRYFGHVTSREFDNLEKDIQLGKAPGKRGKGSLTRLSKREWAVVRAAPQARDRDR